MLAGYDGGDLFVQLILAAVFSHFVSDDVQQSAALLGIDPLLLLLWNN